MNQHDFVKQCFEKYREEGAHPGDGQVWNRAHYPAPRGAGEEEIDLTFEDHQVQGLLQSEEYGRMCFFPPNVREFLSTGPFVEGWFDLWDICEKWTHHHNRQPFEEKDGEGRSVRAVEMGTKGGAKTNSVKNEEGKSAHGVAWNEKLHVDKNELGQSVVSAKGGVARAKQSSQAVQLTEASTGDVFWAPSYTEAALVAGMAKSSVRKAEKQHCMVKGYWVAKILGENPFY